MNDPHVEYLTYVVTHGDSLKAPPAYILGGTTPLPKRQS